MVFRRVVRLRLVFLAAFRRRVVLRRAGLRLAVFRLAVLRRVVRFRVVFLAAFRRVVLRREVFRRVVLRFFAGFVTSSSRNSMNFFHF